MLISLSLSLFVTTVLALKGAADILVLEKKKKKKPRLQARSDFPRQECDAIYDITWVHLAVHDVIVHSQATAVTNRCSCLILFDGGQVWWKEKHEAANIFLDPQAVWKAASSTLNSHHTFAALKAASPKLARFTIRRDLKASFSTSHVRPRWQCQT